MQHFLRYTVMKMRDLAKAFILLLLSLFYLTASSQTHAQTLGAQCGGSVLHEGRITYCGFDILGEGAPSSFVGCSFPNRCLLGETYAGCDGVNTNACNSEEYDTSSCSSYDTTTENAWSSSRCISEMGGCFIPYSGISGGVCVPPIEEQIFDCSNPANNLCQSDNYEVCFENTEDAGFGSSSGDSSYCDCAELVSNEDGSNRWMCFFENEQSHASAQDEYEFDNIPLGNLRCPACPDGYSLNIIGEDAQCISTSGSTLPSYSACGQGFECSLDGIGGCVSTETPDDDGVCGQHTYNNRSTFCSTALDVGHLLNNGTAPYGGCGFGEICFVGADIGDQECSEWFPTDDGPMFCYGGFDSPETLRNSRIEIACVSNCGGANVINPNTPGQTQHSLSGAPVAPDGAGGYYSCTVATSGFDQSFVDAVNYQIDAASLACGTAGIAEFIGAGAVVSRLASVGAGTLSRVLTVPVRLSLQAGIEYASPAVQTCINFANQYRPTFETRVVKPDGTIACRVETSVELNVQDQVIDADTGQILDPRGGLFMQCDDDTVGFQTAIGCIPITDIEGVVVFFIRWSLGVGGGIALFLVAVSSFKIMTAKGDTNSLQEARDTFSSAIAGLVMLILSIFIVRFITETLLSIF